MEIEKLLNYPTKSRYTFLKIISILRMSRITFNRKRYKSIMNKLFDIYGKIIVFVLFNTWRTLAQQKNVAAFKVIELIQTADKNDKFKYLRLWRMKTSLGRSRRKVSFKEAKKMHLIHVYKSCFTKWIHVFYHESMTKMALYHWAKVVESNALNKWRDYALWNIEAKERADKKYKKYMFDKYFTFWLNEFIRMQNERQWKAWRETNQSLEMEKFEKMRAIEFEVVDEKDNVDVRVVSLRENKEKVDDDEEEKEENKIEDVKVKKAYLDTVQSVEPPMTTLFFPYCGTHGDEINEEMNILRISESTDERLSYVKHCELQSILIPTYDSKMVKKYKHK